MKKSVPSVAKSICMGSSQSVTTAVRLKRVGSMAAGAGAVAMAAVTTNRQNFGEAIVVKGRRMLPCRGAEAKPERFRIWW